MWNKMLIILRQFCVKLGSILLEKKEQLQLIKIQVIRVRILESEMNYHQKHWSIDDAKQGYQLPTNDEFEKILQYTKKLQIKSWKIYKIFGQMKLFELCEKQQIIIKGEWVIQKQLEQLIQIYEQESTLKLYQPFLKSIQTLSNNFNENYESRYVFLKNNTKYENYMNYYRKIIIKPSYFILIRNHIQQMKEKQLPIIFVSQKLVYFQEIIVCQTNYRDNNQCSCQLIIVCEQILSSIEKSFIKEYINNHQILNYEQITIEKPQQKNKITETIEEQSPNLQFIPNDRINYVDQNDNHKAFAFIDHHNRLLQITQNKTELEIFQKFQELMKHLELNDNTLIRHLQARQFKIPQAQTMLQNVYEWRKLRNINEIIQQDFSVFDNKQILLNIGEGKMGNPILYIRAENVNDFNEEMTMDRFIDYFIYMMECNCRKMRANQDCQILVIDCFNLSRKNVSVDLIKNLMQQVFLNYPERMFRNMVINTNWLSMSVYNMISKFLPQRTIDKMAFAGTNVKEIYEIFSKDLDISVIPMKYGGQNELIK